jgi:hypothetical protein
MKVSWTPTARKTYFKVLDYLQESWTKRELENFINKVGHVIIQIEENPAMFETSRKKKNIRKGFVTQHNSLYYRIKPKKKEIELLLFWDNRRDPKKLLY